ncbi:MAG: chorismate synthase [Lachnospiraceae bacterium]|nr:chorismate synthase [Lachnospiraceae bacterium]
MRNNSYGDNFTITTWGESHGKALGVVIDGCPAGLELYKEDIQMFLDRRKPGGSKYATQRKEGDRAVILSGTLDNVTTGCPISIMVENENQRSRDYSNIANVYRPGHADYTFDEKYGLRDYRGGGRSSGRETIGRVAGGAVAHKILRELGIKIDCYTKSIGKFAITDPKDVHLDEMDNPLNLPNELIAFQAMDYIEECMKNQDSVGGVIECVIHNVPTGIGEPVFNKLDANLAKAMLSIGAVKGFEMGDGFDVARSKGSDNNDEMSYDGGVVFHSNHGGGVLGGISNGQDIVFRAAIKPTPSISRPQHTIDAFNEEIDINITGRHDPVIVPRAVVVVESMAAITLLDLLMDNMTSKMDNLKKIY